MTAAESPGDRTSALAHILTIVLLIAAYLGLAAAQIESTSGTVDEPIYLRLGRSVYSGRGFSEFLRPMVPSMPIVCQGWAVALWNPQDQSNADPGFAAALRIARYADVAVCGVPLVLLLYAWVGRCYGWRAARLAGAFAALSPFLVGNGALAATDVCFALFGFLGVIALTWYDERPTTGRRRLAAVAIGVALAAKQSALFLLPTAFVVFAWRMRAEGASWFRSVWSAVWRSVGLGAAAFLVSWACYGFAAVPVLDPKLEHGGFSKIMGQGDLAVRLRHILETTPIPLPAGTILGQVSHAMRGHEAYLCGEIRYKSWWYFFPVAVAVKATPAELALVVVALLSLFTPGTWADRRSRTTATAMLAFGAMCLSTSLSLGVRYLSVVYPLAASLGCGLLARTLPPVPALWAGLTVAVVAVQAWSASVAFPDQLAYFNPIAGGPAGGHRFLADASLDWGQGLPALQKEVERRKPKKLLLAYYEYVPGSKTTVEPAAYGISDFIPWRQATEADVAGADLLAVSTSLLVGLGNVAANEFGPLQNVAPVARPGMGFWVYDLSDPGVRAAADACHRITAAAPKPK
jgi:4-amino-4-deoxy-L-arabinose transferase-like glycosyltransferase